MPPIIMLSFNFQGFSNKITDTNYHLLSRLNNKTSAPNKGSKTMSCI